MKDWSEYAEGRVCFWLENVYPTTSSISILLEAPDLTVNWNSMMLPMGSTTLESATPDGLTQYTFTELGRSPVMIPVTVYDASSARRVVALMA